MDTPDWAGPFGQAEARALVTRTLVIESAREAGLQVASSLEADGGLLVVFDPPQGPDQPGAVRKVLVQVTGPGESLDGVDVPAGEIVAIVDWNEDTGAGPVRVGLAGRFDAGPAVTPLDLPVATPERWRALLKGRG